MPRNKMKTDWAFVLNLLCVGAISFMVFYTGKYIDMQAKRIDRLELEMESVMSAVFPPREKPKAEVTWEDKEE